MVLRFFLWGERKSFTGTITVLKKLLILGKQLILLDLFRKQKGKTIGMLRWRTQGLTLFKFPENDKTLDM